MMSPSRESIPSCHVGCHRRELMSRAASQQARRVGTAVKAVKILRDVIERKVEETVEKKLDRQEREFEEHNEDEVDAPEEEEGHRGDRFEEEEERRQGRGHAEHELQPRVARQPHLQPQERGGQRRAAQGGGRGGTRTGGNGWTLSQGSRGGPMPFVVPSVKAIGVESSSMEMHSVVQSPLSLSQMPAAPAATEVSTTMPLGSPAASPRLEQKMDKDYI